MNQKASTNWIIPFFGFSTLSFSWQDFIMSFLGAGIPPCFVGGFAVNWQMLTFKPLPSLNVGTFLGTGW